MLRFPSGRLVVLLSLAALWALPLVASAQEEGESTTTTTIEIETSATSITTTTTTAVVDDEAAGPGQTTDDTLPFTGASTGGLAGMGAVALVGGMALVALTGRAATADAGPRRGRED
ncbi:MAG: hypothetical protein ACLFWM_10525 [Actinomycetota bacterium]